MKEKMLISPALIYLAKGILIKANRLTGRYVNPLGAGVFQNFARNKLNIENWNVSHKGNYDNGKHALQWGFGYDKTSIT